MHFAQRTWIGIFTDSRIETQVTDERIQTSPRMFHASVEFKPRIAMREAIFAAPWWIAPQKPVVG
jgi:hypothetical protein